MSAGLRVGLVLCVGALVAAGCSNKQKKLSSGGGVADTLLYDVLGNERPGAYYFDVVQRSRDPETFTYRPSDDPYLVDKNVDAIQRLGDAPMARLEGQSNVVVMLVEILLEDRSAMARAAAAVSLTKIGARLPRYADTGPGEDGSRLATNMGVLKGLYEGPGGTPRARSAAEREMAARLVMEIGDARFEQGLFSKKALQFFGTTAGLIDERDPGVRAALDTAMTRQSRRAIVYALTAAVDGPADFVRADAVRGLKTLGEASALSAVSERVGVEVSPGVRGEAAEYLGRIGSADAVGPLIRLLEDVDGSVRYRARQALTRVAGQDLGTRARAWRGWARQRFPGAEGLDEPKPAASAPPPGR